MVRKQRIQVKASTFGWKRCPICQKRKPETVGLTAGDGQRWYCGEGCLDQGERQFKANGRTK